MIKLIKFSFNLMKLMLILSIEVVKLMLILPLSLLAGVRKWTKKKRNRKTRKRIGRVKKRGLKKKLY